MKPGGRYRSMTHTRGHPFQGMTLLEMMIVVLLIALLAAIIIPKLTESKKSANESAAITTMKNISSAQAQFREGDKDQDTALDYATSLVELSSVGLLDNVIGSGSKSGYLFSLSGSTYDWHATATPINAQTANRSFYVDTSGVVRWAPASAAADASSPPVGD